MTEWKAGDVAEAGPDRLVQVMYPPRDGQVFVRDIDTSYRKMSVSDLWAFALAGDTNAAAELRHRDNPSLPAPLPGFVVSFVDVKVLRSATVDSLSMGGGPR
jgi:hypothetical protein